MTEYVKDGIIVEGQRGPIILDYFVVVLVIFAFVISVGIGTSSSGFILSDYTRFFCPGIVILVNHHGRKIKLDTTDLKIF